MAKVVDADKLIETLRQNSYHYRSTYGMPYVTDPHLQSAFSMTNAAIQQIENNINQRFDTLINTLIASIQLNAVEHKVFDCLLCRPGDEGCIPGIDPNQFKG